MKKNLLKGLSMALIASTLVACGSSDAASTTTETEATAATETETATVESDAEVKTVLIGISPDYPPYDTLDDNGDIDGFDADMTAWLFNWLQENGYNYDYEWKSMSFDTIISAVQTDQVDLGIAGFTYKEGRQVLFSDPYYTEYQVILVSADNEDITSGDDLVGKSIGVQMGTVAEGLAEEIEDADVLSIEDNSIVVETLKAGGVDAAIMGSAVAAKYAANGDLKVVGEALESSGNHIIAAEDNQELMDVINLAVNAFIESDDYAELTEKWFTE